MSWASMTSYTKILPSGSEPVFMTSNAGTHVTAKSELATTPN
jgi:hypothetical protein